MTPAQAGVTVRARRAPASLTIAVVALGLALAGCATGDDDLPRPFAERWRPQFHYSAPQGRLADPNGLVFDAGEWHLFHQQDGTWAHAVSPDVVHWTTLPTALVRGGEAAGSDLVRSYPARGAEVLRDLNFLSGSLDAIAHHREPLTGTAGTDPAGLPARIVGLADEYDLVTEVGTPDGALLRPEEALRRLGEGSPGSAELLRALEHAVARTTGVAS